MNDDYETEYSHYHCFEKENPPCGLPGKHRCCLCKKEPATGEKREGEIHVTKGYMEQEETTKTEAAAVGVAFGAFIIALILGGFLIWPPASYYLGKWNDYWEDEIEKPCVVDFGKYPSQYIELDYK